MNKPLIQKIVIAIVVLILLAVGLAWIFRPKHKAPAVVQIQTTNQPMLGKPEAKVKLVVFEDLKCIACKNFNNTVFPKIKEKYIDTGLVNYTIINLAFIPGSMPAANAARCLYQENPQWFFIYVDHLYQNQPPEQDNWATIPKLVEFANVIPGVDQEKLSRCIYDSPYNELIEKNFALAKKVIGSPVLTPSLYINGRRVNPVTWDQIDQIIKNELNS